MTELTMDSPEVKEAIKKAVDEANKKHEEAVKPLRDKHSDLLGEIRGLKDKLKDAPDPAEFEKLKQLAKEIEDKNHKQNIEENDMEAVVKKYEDRIAEIMAAKEQEVSEAQKKAEKLQSSYTRSTTERVALEALAKRKVPPEVMLNNILPLLETTFTEDGKFNTIVKDASGNQRIDPSTNQPVTVDALLDEFSLNPAFAPNFQQSSGGGSRDGKTPNVSGVTKLSDLKTNEDKMAYIEKHGRDEYAKLCNKG